ncbi:MAG: hypothetical protein JW760_11875 [Spirochaetales bacterium]|nr:hypothetical protein [Spirochaetales bacterium]
MKRIFFTVILFITLSFSVSAESDGWWEFHSEFDLYISLKAGAEYHYNDSFGLRGSLGACTLSPSQISYTLVGISHFQAPEKPFQLDLQYGLIQAVFDVIAPSPESGPYAYWVLGPCLAVGYRNPKGHCFRIRGGGGLGFGYDWGAWEKPSFMPNVGIEYGYAFRK